MPIRALVFDLDGILVDSEPAHLQAETVVLKEFGIEFTAEAKRPLVGLGTLDAMRGLIELYDLRLTPEELLARKVSVYLGLVDSLPPYEPCTRLARTARERGYPVAVASGSTLEMIEDALRAIDLRGEVDVVVSADEVERGKPAPDIFLEAAARLGIAPGQCLVVEDSTHGVLAAHAAGMSSIAIPSSPPPLADEFALADLVVEGGMAEADSGELMEWIAQRS